MALQIQLRRDTAANWTSANPILAQGEFGFETNTGKFKIGNGSTAWNSLAYSTPALSGTSPITYTDGVIAINQALITIAQSQVTNLVTDLAAKASLTGAETLTNKTLTAPRFATSGEIDDANGNELVRFPSTVASAVNEVTISNAATGGAPAITATGDDTNISINLVPKGTGTVQAGGVGIVTTTGTQTLTNKTLTSPVISTISNTGTVTLPTATDTLVGRATTDTLSNKTLTAPRFASAGEIDDANGNEIIRFPATVASAVNEITLSNSATGAAPSIAATGDDTNISLNLVSKGTGTVQVNGVTVLTITGTAASATNLAGGGAGRIPYQSGSGTTLFTLAGTAGQVLTSNGTSAPTWAAAPSTGFNAFLLSGM